MPDPNPKGLIPENPTLPNAEYIELFNLTEKAIKLNNFNYNGATIPQVLVQPQEHLILCAATNKDLFQPFGKVAGMETFPALINNGGVILIKDDFGNLLDSLSYDRSLYADKEKENGGWSIERINPFLNCDDTYNWKATAAAQGGLPEPQTIDLARLQIEGFLKSLSSKLCPPSKSNLLSPKYFLLF